MVALSVATTAFSRPTNKDKNAGYSAWPRRRPQPAKYLRTFPIFTPLTLALARRWPTWRWAGRGSILRRLDRRLRPWANVGVLLGHVVVAPHDQVPTGSRPQVLGAVVPRMGRWVALGMPVTPTDLRAADARVAGVAIPITAEPLAVLAAAVPQKRDCGRGQVQRGRRG